MTTAAAHDLVVESGTRGHRGRPEVVHGRPVLMQDISTMRPGRRTTDPEGATPTEAQEVMMTVPTTQRATAVHPAADGRTGTARVRDAWPDPDLGLTQREHDVVRLMAGGLTAYSIGRALVISERTVHKHLQNAYRKLGANDRLSAVRIFESVDLRR